MAGESKVDKLTDDMWSDVLMAHEVFKCQGSLYVNDIRLLMDSRNSLKQSSPERWLDLVNNVLHFASHLLCKERVADIPLSKLVPEFLSFAPRSWFLVREGNAGDLGRRLDGYSNEAIVLLNELRPTLPIETKCGAKEEMRLTV